MKNSGMITVAQAQSSGPGAFRFLHTSEWLSLGISMEC